MKLYQGKCSTVASKSKFLIEFHILDWNAKLTSIQNYISPISTLFYIYFTNCIQSSLDVYAELMTDSRIEIRNIYLNAVSLYIHILLPHLNAIDE